MPPFMPAHRLRPSSHPEPIHPSTTLPIGPEDGGLVRNSEDHFHKIDAVIPGPGKGEDDSPELGRHARARKINPVMIHWPGLRANILSETLALGASVGLVPAVVIIVDRLSLENTVVSGLMLPFTVQGATIMVYGRHL